MAILESSSKTSFQLELLDQEGDWLNYQLKFKAGDREIRFKSQYKKVTTALGTEGEIGKFAFSLKPNNELELLKQNFQKILNGEVKTFSFEPADPSFEIHLEKIQDEFKVHIWVDRGNSQSLEYSWDGIGLRMICSKEALIDFTEDLQSQ